MDPDRPIPSDADARIYGANAGDGHMGDAPLTDAETETRAGAEEGLPAPGPLAPLIAGKDLARALGVKPPTLSEAARCGYRCAGYDVQAWVVRSGSGRALGYRHVPPEVRHRLATGAPATTDRAEATAGSAPEEAHPAARRSGELPAPRRPGTPGAPETALRGEGSSRRAQRAASEETEQLRREVRRLCRAQERDQREIERLLKAQQETARELAALRAEMREKEQTRRLRREEAEAAQQEQTGQDDGDIWAGLLPVLLGAGGLAGLMALLRQRGAGPTALEPPQQGRLRAAPPPDVPLQLPGTQGTSQTASGMLPLEQEGGAAPPEPEAAEESTRIHWSEIEGSMFEDLLKEMDEEARARFIEEHVDLSGLGEAIGQSILEGRLGGQKGDS